MRTSFSKVLNVISLPLSVARATSSTVFWTFSGSGDFSELVLCGEYQVYT